MPEAPKNGDAPIDNPIPPEGNPGQAKPRRFRTLSGFRERVAKRQAAREAWERKKRRPDPHAPMEEKVEFLANRISESQLAELVAMYSNPRRMFWVNLLMGMGRGLGYGIGLGLLTGIAIYLLQKLIAANLPYISDWLATIIHLVDQKARP